MRQVEQNVGENRGGGVIRHLVRFVLSRADAVEAVDGRAILGVHTADPKLPGYGVGGRGPVATRSALPDDAPLLPELLGQNGYTTFGTGKWHNRRDIYARCFGESGKVFFGGMNDQFAMPVNDFDPAGAYPPEECYIANGYSTTVFADEMIDFLNTRGGEDDEPFFAYIAFTSPHDPRTPPAPYDSMYDPAEVELPPNFVPEHPFDIGIRDIRDELLAGYPRGEDEVKGHIADYYGMISHMDMDIGRILAALDARGLSEDTIVIYTSDHGLGVGQHGLMGKQNLYDHSMRIPLIMRGPGIPRGLTCDALLYLLDLYPTLLELAGVDVPETCDGHSLAALLNGVTYKHRRQIFSAYQGVFGHPQGQPWQRSIKDERNKLIQTVVEGEETWQLFDLAADPYERVNLIDQPDYDKVTQRLRAGLRDRQTRANDPLLTDAQQSERK